MVAPQHNTLHPDTVPLPFSADAVHIDLAPRLKDFDRRGALADLAAETWSIIEPYESDYIRVFAEHFAQADGMRGRWTPEQIYAAMFRDNNYTRKKLANPTQDDWVGIACHHAWGVRSGGVPLSSPLAALDAAYGFLGQKLYEAVGQDEARYERLAPVLPRLAMLETEILSAATSAIREQELAHYRAKRAWIFQTEIIARVDNVSRSGVRMGQMAEKTQSSAHEMHAKATDVARGAERSSGLMRDAASTAMRLRGAIESNRETIVSSWAVALAAVQQTKAAIQLSDAMKTHASEIGSTLQGVSSIARQIDTLARSAASEAEPVGGDSADFTQVAWEVNRLAAQTVTAIAEVAPKVAAIQAASETNAERAAAIRRTVDTVRKSADRLLVAIDQQCEAVISITASVTETADAAVDMAQATEAIASATGTVQADMADLETVLRDVTDGLQSLRLSCLEFTSEISAEH